MQRTAAALLHRIPQKDLNELISLLEIQVIGLSECLVSPGFVLELDGNAAPGIHYILSGKGLLHIRGAAPIVLAPHTLMIVPPNHSLRFEVPSPQAYARSVMFMAWDRPSIARARPTSEYADELRCLPDPLQGLRAYIIATGFRSQRSYTMSFEFFDAVTP